MCCGLQCRDTILEATVERVNGLVGKSPSASLSSCIGALMCYLALYTPNAALRAYEVIQCLERRRHGWERHIETPLYNYMICIFIDIICNVPEDEAMWESLYAAVRGRLMPTIAWLLWDREGSADRRTAEDCWKLLPASFILMNSSFSAYIMPIAPSWHTFNSRLNDLLPAICWFTLTGATNVSSYIFLFLSALRLLSRFILAVAYIVA